MHELVYSRQIILQHIAGIHNPADLLTKPLSRATLTHLFRILRKLAWGGESPDSTNTLRSSGSKRKVNATASGSAAKRTKQ